MPIQQPYTPAYYATFVDTSLPSAQQIVPWLLERCPVRSVVDVGCGDGTWLSAFSLRGVEHLLGIDGPWVLETDLRISHSQFMSASLEAPLPEVGRYDLALNLEVAEHLSQGRAAGLVQDLCRLAPLVAFSAAIPGQGGAHHVNEQWPAYWCGLFAPHGYHPIDCLRPQFWQSDNVAWCYRQNMMLFASKEAEKQWPWLSLAPRLPGSVALPLVHPDRFLLYQSAGVGFWLRSGWPALRRTVRRRLISR